MTQQPQEKTASAAAVAGLAREVEALRRAIDMVRGLPRQVDDLARVVTELAADVARTPRGKLVAPSWLDSPGDIAKVRAVLEDLTGWLSEVYLRYADAAHGLPECWLWHPDIVEELLWLMYAWIAAYRDDSASAALAGDWHDRYRPGVVRRIKSLAGTCSLENHQPGGARHRGRPMVPLAEAMSPIAEWWATQRTEAGPEPTDEQLTAGITAQDRGGRR